jgi:hypothetical protein
MGVPFDGRGMPSATMARLAAGNRNSEVTGGEHQMNVSAELALGMSIGQLT